VDSLLVDLATGQLRGRTPTREPAPAAERILPGSPASVMGLARDGRLLVGFSVDRSGSVSGPLEWVPPGAAGKP
jgi:hypothetical protein